MIRREEMLKQAAQELERHSNDLAALRKSKPEMNTSPNKLRADIPHYTLVVSGKGEKNKLNTHDPGIRLIIFEEEEPIGTMDFLLKDDAMFFSHFTFNNGSRIFYEQLLQIYENYPDETMLELLKLTMLGRSAIRFSSGDTTEYVEIDTNNATTDILNESSFMKKYNAERKRMLDAEKKYKDKKALK